MDIEKLIEQLRDKGCEDCPHRDTCRDDDTAECVIRLNVATALSTLKAENEKLRAELYSLRPGFQNQKALIKQLRTELEQKEKYYEQMVDALAATESAELEQVKRLYESEKEDFIDFVCSGVPNLSPYCLNRHPDCVDERGWCRTEKCRGFSRERGQKED